VRWRIEVGTVDREAVLIVLHWRESQWEPAYPVRIRVAGGLIGSITDHYACPWVLAPAGAVEPGTAKIE
jgi:RNA polymerase sigma-70 factor (ECF subfamily)